MAVVAIIAAAIFVGYLAVPLGKRDLFRAEELEEARPGDDHADGGDSGALPPVR